ncbi:MAG: hypothetical protein ACJ746_31905 [Bryobacteraceae bacterium]
MAKNENRCWPGYEPVPGKTQHEQGSCRPKAESKLSGSEKDFRGKRKKQLESWKVEHPGSPKKAAQHLHAPGQKTKTAGKKAATKKATKKAAAKRATAKKTAARKRTPARSKKAA